MKKIKLVFLFLLLAACLFTAGCQKFEGKLENLPEPYDREIFALDTFINLRLYHDNPEYIADLAEEKIFDLENLLSVTNSGSDVSMLNSNGTKAVKVNDETLDVIETATNVSRLTDGSLDITVYPLVKLWGFTTDELAVPSRNEIDKALESVDYSRITIDKNGGTVKLAEKTEIDLGAVAKGYIAEQIKNLMKQNGVESAVLSFGGNIQTIGTKNGEPWKVGIKYPFTEDSFAVLDEGEIAVVTSATDQRYFKTDGKLYHHIIDPKSGYPVDNGTLSVTVVCSSGAMADALSTSIFVMGAGRARELYQRSDGFEFIILDDKKNVFVTEGLRDNFSLSDQYENLNVVIVKNRILNIIY